MAKRFSDTEKWEDPWFRNLSPIYQRFWIYLLDKCDSAGVWEVDWEMVRFFIKTEINSVEAQQVFDRRISVFDDGKYWAIVKFINFQYGELSTDSKPHLNVLRLLGLYELKGYPKGIHTLKDKAKDKDKDKAKDKGPIMADLSTDQRKVWRPEPIVECGGCGFQFKETKFDAHKKECRNWK